MKRSLTMRTLAILALGLLTACGGGGGGGSNPQPSDRTGDATPPPATDLWVTAYYAGWQADYLPADQIDFSAFTHLAHFAVLPAAGGSLDFDTLGLTPNVMDTVVGLAHAAKRKVVLTVGGWGTQAAFEDAMTDANRATFVANLVAVVKQHGYDGLDLDMEPMNDADRAPYSALVGELRSALDAAGSHLLLTAAIGWEVDLFAALQDSFDQVNLMTYDLAGPWDGWETWHNASLYDGGLTFASTGEPLPSIEGLVRQALDSGMDASKLGIGIDFYGYVWHGASEPNQSLDKVTMFEDKSYAEIMKLWGEGEDVHRWQPGPEASYLSIGGDDPAFVSYDDARLCAAKIDYVRTRGIGGAIIWELGGGWQPSAPKGQRDVLLQAVGAALRGE